MQQTYWCHFQHQPNFQSLWMTARQHLKLQQGMVSSVSERPCKCLKPYLETNQHHVCVWLQESSMQWKTLLFWIWTLKHSWRPLYVKFLIQPKYHGPIHKWHLLCWKSGEGWTFQHAVDQGCQLHQLFQTNVSKGQTEPSHQPDHSS